MKRFFKDFGRFWEYARYAAKASLEAEVAGSYLNWVWWILEPFCFMLVYTFIFGVVFEARESHFALFVYIGLTVWNFYNKSVKSSVRLIKRNKGTISKVYIPKFILVITEMLVNAFKFLIACAITAVLMIVQGVGLSIYFLNIFPLAVMLFLVTFACCMLVMHIGVYVQDLSNIVNIFFRVLMYMTGIFYSIEHRLGDRYPTLSRIMTDVNPLAYLVTGFRNAVVYKEPMDYRFWALWVVIAIVVSAICIRTVYKNENNYVKVI